MPQPCVSSGEEWRSRSSPGVSMRAEVGRDPLDGGCRRIPFRAGETIHTESSYKYSLSQFQDLARSANWQPSRTWTDPRQLFSVHELISS